MKNTLLLFLLLYAGHLFSQQEIILTEEIQNYLIGNKNSIVVTIPYGEATMIEKQLKREMKSWDGSFYVNRGEYTVVQGKISLLGSGTINSYAKIKSGQDEYIRVVFTFDLGGVFLSSSEHAAQFKSMGEKIREFAKETSVKCLEEQISKEKEKLSFTKKNLKMLEKEKTKLTQDINQYKEFIIAAEKNLETNIKNQSKTFESIQQLESKIDEIEKRKKKIKKD